MEKQTKKPSKGTWDRLGNEGPRTDKVTFDINIPVTVTLADEPEEKEGEDGGVYYEFPVFDGETPKIIQTSAWTLLNELKKLTPLEGKKVTITKKMDKGRQYFILDLVP